MGDCSSNNQFSSSLIQQYVFFSKQKKLLCIYSKADQFLRRHKILKQHAHIDLQITQKQNNHMSKVAERVNAATISPSACSMFTWTLMLAPAAALPTTKQKTTVEI